MDTPIIADKLAQSIAYNFCESRTYLCFSNFLIVASDIYNELDEYSVFIVHKVYGRKNIGDRYSICLFDSYYQSTVGFISNDSLELFQDIAVGRLRLTYVPKIINVDLSSSKKNSDIKNIVSSIKYQFCADISTDGNNWQPFMQGIYR